MHRAYHSTICATTVDKSGAQAALHWFVVSGAQLMGSLLLANAIPFFSDIQNLLVCLALLLRRHAKEGMADSEAPRLQGTLTGAPIVFGWPAFFYLRGAYLKGLPVRWSDKLICGIYLCIFLPIFTILGTINAVKDIVVDVESTKAPFQC